MNKREVEIIYCSFGGKVGDFLGNHYAHDCFCSWSKNSPDTYFQYDQKVLNFIDNAINEKIARETVTTI